VLTQQLRPEEKKKKKKRKGGATACSRNLKIWGVKEMTLACFILPYMQSGIQFSLIIHGSINK
jgi:hypothetical protein